MTPPQVCEEAPIAKVWTLAGRGGKQARPAPAVTNATKGAQTVAANKMFPTTNMNKTRMAHANRSNAPATFHGNGKVNVTQKQTKFSTPEHLHSSTAPARAAKQPQNFVSAVGHSPTPLVGEKMDFGKKIAYFRRERCPHMVRKLEDLNLPKFPGWRSVRGKHNLPLRCFVIVRHELRYSLLTPTLKPDSTDAGAVND